MPALLIASLFLIFSISLAPGFFGARLGDLDAFVPEGSSTAFVRAPRTPQPTYKISKMTGALAHRRAQE